MNTGDIPLERASHVYQIRSEQSRHSFLETLRDVLELHHLGPAICWSDDGLSLKIHNCDLLRDAVLPLFKMCPDLKSFIQQLIIHKFRTTCRKTEDQILCYSHPTFQKGRYELLAKSRVRRKESRGISKETNPEVEPKKKKVIKVSKENSIHAGDDQMHPLLVAHQQVFALTHSGIVPIIMTENDFFAIDQDYMDLKKELTSRFVCGDF